MRSFAAVLAVSILTTGAASAQMKVPQSTPNAPGQRTIATPVAQKQMPLESARRINRDDAMKLVKNKKAVYVDVRSKDSYDAGHIKGAINIPLSELIGTRLREIPPGKMIITYCA